MNEEHWSNGPCPKFDCRKKNKCGCCGLRYVNIPASLTTDAAPKNGDFCNAIVQYEGTGEVWIYSAEGIPTLVYKETKGGSPVIGGGMVVYVSDVPRDDETVYMFRDREETIPITVREVLDALATGANVVFKDTGQDTYYPITWAMDCPDDDLFEIDIRTSNTQLIAVPSEESDVFLTFGAEKYEVANLAQLNMVMPFAPSIDMAGELGQLYIDTSTMHTYQCTAISGDRYTWTQRW